MRNEIADFVYPIIERIMSVKQRLDNQEVLSIDEEQLILTRLLTQETKTVQTQNVMNEKDYRPSFDELRYAMVCLIDEFFINSTCWSHDWNERKLESRRYSTNDRAWKFWKCANHALSVGDADTVEVYLVCVILGFRGQMVDDRQGLNDWFQRTERFVEARRCRLYPEPASGEPRTFVPPLYGRQSLEAAVLRLGILSIGTLFMIMFITVQKLGGL